MQFVFQKSEKHYTQSMGQQQGGENEKQSIFVFEQMLFVGIFSPADSGILNEKDGAAQREYGVFDHNILSLQGKDISLV